MIYPGRFGEHDRSKISAEDYYCPEPVHSA